MMISLNQERVVLGGSLGTLKCGNLNLFYAFMGGVKTTKDNRAASFFTATSVSKC